MTAQEITKKFAVEKQLKLLAKKIDRKVVDLTFCVCDMGDGLRDYVIIVYGNKKEQTSLHVDVTGYCLAKIAIAVLRMFVENPSGSKHDTDCSC